MMNESFYINAPIEQLTTYFYIKSFDCYTLSFKAFSNNYL